MGHNLLVTRSLAVVDQDLGLLTDGVGVAADLGQRAATHQQASEQDGQQAHRACSQSCPAAC